MLVRRRVLALLFSLTFITYLDRVCISATAEAMSQELGLSKTQMGQVFSIFVLGYVLFEIPGGWLADRFGVRALLARVVIWWSAFTAFTGGSLELRKPNGRSVPFRLRRGGGVSGLRPLRFRAGSLSLNEDGRRPSSWSEADSEARWPQLW